MINAQWTTVSVCSGLIEFYAGNRYTAPDTQFKTDKQSEKYYRLVVNMLDRVYIRCSALKHSSRYHFRTYWEFK